MLSYIGDFQEQISDTNDTFNDVSGDVKHYSSIRYCASLLYCCINWLIEFRKSVVAAILVLPITLTGLALAGVAFKIKILLKMYLLLLVITYIVFNLLQICRILFCVHVLVFCYFWSKLYGYAPITYGKMILIIILAFYTLDQLCKNQDEIVSNALSIASGDIMIFSSIQIFSTISIY